MATNKNSVLVVNQLYKQDLNIFQKQEIQKHKANGGLVNIRTNIRDDTTPFFTYVPLKNGLFCKSEQPQEQEVPAGFRGYIEGKGFFSGTENG